MTGFRVFGTVRFRSDGATQKTRGVHAEIICSFIPIAFIAGSMLLMLALIGYTPVALQAQSAAAAGQIVGQVTDPSSGSVNGVEVTVRNVNTNYKRTATTDSEGRYAIPELPLGPYEVTATATGFAAETQNVFVSLGSSVTAAFHMTVAPQSQNLEVNADTPVSSPPGPLRNRY